MNAPSIVKLDRRLSAAAEAGTGMKLGAGDLELLVATGVLETIHAAKSEYLKEQSRCRSMKRRSIDGGNTGSLGIVDPMAPSDHPTSPSFGTTQPRDASEALQRGRRKRTRPS